MTDGADIPNEFVTSILDPEQRKVLQRLNDSITERVLNCVCPAVSSFAGITPFLLTQQTPEAKAKKATRSDERCKCDPMAPTNQILYGTPICQSLASLYFLGLTKCDLVELDAYHNIIWPWTIQYNADRLGSNKRLQYFPLMIVFPTSVSDVSFWIKFSKEYNVTPSIRSGGHSYEYFSGSNPLIIDLSYLRLPGKEKRQICLDSKTGLLEVVPGARLGKIYAELAKDDRIIAGGICPSVCIGGLVTGGGIGYFIRRFGYTCDTVVEIEIVLASGEIVCARNPHLYKATSKGDGAPTPKRNSSTLPLPKLEAPKKEEAKKEEPKKEAKLDEAKKELKPEPKKEAKPEPKKEAKPEPKKEAKPGKKEEYKGDRKCVETHADLFRALKGGGNGSFGVVTKYVIQTHVVRRIVSFSYVFHMENFVKVGLQFQRFIPGTSSRLGAFVINCMAGSPLFVLNGLYVASNTWDSKETLNRFYKLINEGFLFPLAEQDAKSESSDVQVRSYLSYERELALESLLPPFYKIRSRYLFEPGLTSEEWFALAVQLRVPPRSRVPGENGFFALQIAAFGPGNNKQPVDSSVLTARGNSLAFVHMASNWDLPESTAVFTAYVNAFYNLVSTFPNMKYGDPNVADAELNNDFMDVLYNGSQQFLVATKTKYDPQDLFRFAQSIPVQSGPG